jgi:PEGA domain
MRPAYILALTLWALPLPACMGAQAGQLADDPDVEWIPGLPVANSFAGVLDLSSDPSGAEATTSLGGSCRTPCSLEVQAEGPFTVTFTREGHEPSTVQVKIHHAQMGVSNRKFAPNPVVANLAPIAEPARPQAAPKKTVTPRTPPQPATSKPTAALQSAASPAESSRPIRGINSPIMPAAQPARAQSEWPAQVKPLPGINSSPIVPAARPAPAQSDWPGEVKPIPGINSSPIVPSDAAK